MISVYLLLDLLLSSLAKFLTPQLNIPNNRNLTFNIQHLTF